MTEEQIQDAADEAAETIMAFLCKRHTEFPNAHIGELVTELWIEDKIIEAFRKKNAMKAKEYVEKLMEYLKSPPDDIWTGKPEDVGDDDPETDAVVAVCRDLIMEGKGLIAARKSKSLSAMEAVFREQDQKWQAIVRLAEGRFTFPLPPNFLRIVLVEFLPSLQPLVEKWPVLE